MVTTDGKTIVNMLYHAGVESVLTIGYAEIARKILKRPSPKVDFNMVDVGMLSVDILLAMATRGMLVKQGIIPADIMKYFFYYLYLKTTIKNGKCSSYDGRRCSSECIGILW